MKKHMKSVVGALVAVSLVATSLPTSARVGSSSSKSSSYSSSSRSSSYSSPSRSSSSYSNKSSDRAGGGSSIGMSRSRAMSEARSQQAEARRSYESPSSGSTSQGYSPGSNSSSRSGSNSSYANSNSYPQPQQNYNYGSSGYRSGGGYSGGQVATAAVVGALAAGTAGYAMAQNNQPAPATAPTPAAQQQAVTQPQNGEVNPQYSSAPAPQYHTASNGEVLPGQAAASTAPTKQLVEQKKSADAIDGFPFGQILMLLALIILGVVIARKMFSSAKPAASYGNSAQKTDVSIGSAVGAPKADERSKEREVAQELLNCSKTMFVQVQEANNRGDKETLARLIDDADLLAVILDEIDAREEPTQTRVLSLGIVGNKVLDFEKTSSSYIGSIHFAANIAEGGEPAEDIQEVWHFARSLSGGDWKLCGIEQI